MNTGSSVILSDIECISSNRREISLDTRDITIREKTIISGMKKIYDEEKEGSITSLVPDKDTLKIVSSKNYRRVEYIKKGDVDSYNGYWFWLISELKSYEEYLDFLYKYDVTEVYAEDIKPEEFEALIKALMIKYELILAAQTEETMMKLGTKHFNSFVIFDSSLIRPSFNNEFLLKVKHNMEDLKEAKNIPSLEMLYKYFLDTPRPTMKVKSYRND